MQPDSPSLEQQLRSLAICPLDSSLLDRLESAANGNLTQLTREEIDFEAVLRQCKPLAVDQEFLNQFDRIAQHTPFPLNQKIVVFPQATQQQGTSIGHRPFWATAAAVALLGSAAALMMPTQNSSQRNGNTAAISTQHAVSSPAQRGIQPASYQSNVREIHDDGVFWKSNSQPHQVLRLIHNERITLNQTNGRTVEVEQPRIQYLLVPTRTD